MLTTEQLDNWFTYHPPTEEQAPKYAHIRNIEEVFRKTLLFNAIPAAKTPLAAYSMINDAARNLAYAIDANAPDCADKDAAIRCVRIARNAANEAIATMNGDGVMEEMINACIQVAIENAMAARWQANSAIACGGK
jgi:hypothetical protein